MSSTTIIDKLTEKRMFILDTESTGINPNKDQILEIYIQGFRLNPKRKFSAAFHSLINPNCRIPPSASAINHITDDDVANEETLETIIPTLLSMVKDRPLIAYNSDYDRILLSQKNPNYREDTLRMVQDLYDQDWIDVQRLAMKTWYRGELNPAGFPLMSFKLQELRYWLHTPKVAGSAHRAATDVVVTGHVMRAAIDRQLKQNIFPDDYSAFMNWLKAPIHYVTVPFGPLAGKRPEELSFRDLTHMWSPNNYLYSGYQKWDVHQWLMPLYQKEIVRNQARPKPAPIAGQKASLQPSFTPPPKPVIRFGVPNAVGPAKQ